MTKEEHLSRYLGIILITVVMFTLIFFSTLKFLPLITPSIQSPLFYFSVACTLGLIVMILGYGKARYHSRLYYLL